MLLRVKLLMVRRRCLKMMSALMILVVQNVEEGKLLSIDQLKYFSPFPSPSSTLVLDSPPGMVHHKAV